MACPAENLLNILTKKWTVLIIEELDRNPHVGFNELSSKLRFVSPKILSEHLKDLEKNTMITKKIKSMDPLRVAYNLTPKGKECKVIIKNIKRLGGCEARDEYCAACSQFSFSPSLLTYNSNC